MKQLLGAIAALCLIAPSAAAAPAGAASADYSGQVRTYLADQATKHTSEGFRPETSIQDLILPLRLEGGAIWPINLRAGVTYRIFGACDNDCSDVDLEVYDSTGLYAGRDVAVNDTPYVEITPTHNGVHYARIWLAACESEPCYVGMRVYRK
jgi:hypothetical protein